MIIFDFDQTLVDTSSLAPLRQRRRWSEVQLRMRDIDPYPDIEGLLGELHRSGEALAIVTNSPRIVPEGYISYRGWPINNVIGYHEVARRKPAPDAIRLALTRAKIKTSMSFYIGDQPEDVLAAHAAGVVAIGAGWGSQAMDQLNGAEPDHLFMTVPELRTFLMDNVSNTG